MKKKGVESPKFSLLKKTQLKKTLTKIPKATL